MRATFALSALALLTLAPAALPQAATSATPATATLSVNASLVVVPVTVRDNKDRLLRSLNREDFTLNVDGKQQAIRYFDRDDDVPLTVGLLVDTSGSMRNELENERTASSAFLDGMLQPGRDKAFVVEFSQSADLLADVTSSVPKLQAALQKLDGSDDRPSFHNGGNSGNGSSGNGNDPQDTADTNSNNNSSYGGYGRRGGRGGRSGGPSNGGGGTVLYDAVFLSSDEVLKKPAPKAATTAPAAQGPTRKALILLTDGQDRGSKESLPAAIEAAQRTDVALYAIYYKNEEGGSFGGGNRGGWGGGFPGGRGGGFPGGGGGGYPGGGRGGNGGGGREHVDGKKILERMADETGGRVYEVSKKTPLNEIYRQIAEELRSQYRLGFTPANNEAGYHKVVVDLPKEKKAILQARDGYYTGGQDAR